MTQQHNNNEDYAFIHIAKRQMSVERIISELYYQASPEALRYFQMLNTHIKDQQVMPGQAMIIAPPKGTECTQFEQQLMASVKRLELQRNALAQQEKETLGRYYGLLDNVANYSGIGYGISLNYFKEHARQIKNTFTEIEQIFLNSYNQYGDFNNQRFFYLREQKFGKIKTILDNMVGKSILGPYIDTHNVRTGMGLSTKSILHKIKAQGIYPIESIPGFEANYAKVANLSRKLKVGGYIAITLDVGQSLARIHQACTVDAGKQQCGRTEFKETGRVIGSVGGGYVGGAIGVGLCNIVFAVPSSGTSLLWCGIIVGGVGGYAGSVGLSGYLETKGEKLYESLITIQEK